MPAQVPRYLSFMLRCWQEQSQTPNPVVWRFSLENVETGERLGFADAEALMAFLHTQIAPKRHDTELDI